MIEISISRELADAHPGFMAHCAQRGHQVEVFGDEGSEPSERCGQGTSAQASESPSEATTDGCERRVRPVTSATM